jgi:hypothetical protein
MVHAHTFKYAFLALGLSASLGLALGLSASLTACGGGEDMGTTSGTYSANIQKDMMSLSCLAVGCHDKNSTTKLKIDATGDAMTNYQSLLTNQLIVKNDAANSRLLVVPSTGMSKAAGDHVKTLAGTKLTEWQAWVNAGAPF